MHREIVHRFIHGMVGALGVRPGGAPLERPIKRLLCIVQGGLGDRLMTLPALRLLRQRHPRAHICVAWCGESLPEIDAEFDETRRIRPNGVIEQWRLMREGWDCLFVNSIGAHSVATELAAMLGGIPDRIGPRWPFQNRSAYNRPYDVPAGLHITAANCRAVDWSQPATPRGYPVSFGRAHVECEEGQGPVVMHVGHRLAHKHYARKSWPIEKYAELIRRLVSDNVGEAGVILGPDEEKLSGAELIAAGAKVLRPKSLADLFSAIASARLFVGNDSGPAHAAAALGVPEVVLFGPSNPRRSAPVSERAVLVLSGITSPLRYDELVEHRPAGMEGIEVETALEAVRLALHPEISHRR